jgi:membrane protein implicated in regulation of membrane protease activity
MNHTIAWFLAAGLVLILELFTGTFYLLMTALGIAAGGLAALAGVSVPWQAAVAAVVGIAATLLLRRSRFGKPARMDAARDPNVNLDIGQRIGVDRWSGGCARVMYRGALWDVELAPGFVPPGDAIVHSIYIICEVRGSRLIVKPSPDNEN